MKKVDYTLVLGIFVALVALYFITRPTIQGFQDTPYVNPSPMVMAPPGAPGMQMPPASVTPMPTTPSNDAANAGANPNLPNPTTTPAAMNTATTTIKLSDLQTAKNALSGLKAALDNLH